MSNLDAIVARLEDAKYPHGGEELGAAHIRALDIAIAIVRERLPAVGGGEDALLNPRKWTREMSDAWHRALPDTQAAFDALRTFRTPAPLPIRGELGDRPVNALGFAIPQTIDDLRSPCQLPAAQEAAVKIEAVTDRVKELEDALRFYADEGNWDSPMGIPRARDDHGEIARQAIGVQPLKEIE